MTPEQEQGQGRMGYIPIFHVLKLFQVVCFNDTSMASKCPVLAPDTASGNGFCIILVLVPVSVPDINDREPIRGEFTGAESPWNRRGAVLYVVSRYVSLRWQHNHLGSWGRPRNYRDCTWEI